MDRFADEPRHSVLASPVPRRPRPPEIGDPWCRKDIAMREESECGPGQPASVRRAQGGVETPNPRWTLVATCTRPKTHRIDPSDWVF